MSTAFDNKAFSAAVWAAMEARGLAAQRVSMAQGFNAASIGQLD